MVFLGLVQFSLIILMPGMPDDLNVCFRPLAGAELVKKLVSISTPIPGFIKLVTKFHYCHAVD